MAAGGNINGCWVAWWGEVLGREVTIGDECCNILNSKSSPV